MYFNFLPRRHTASIDERKLKERQMAGFVLIHHHIFQDAGSTIDWALELFDKNLIATEFFAPAFAELD